MMTNELSQYKVGFEEGSRLAGKPTQTSDDSNLVDEAAVAAAAGSTSMAAPVPLVGLGLAAAVPSDALSGASSFGSLKEATSRSLSAEENNSLGNMHGENSQHEKHGLGQSTLHLQSSQQQALHPLHHGNYHQGMEAGPTPLYHGNAPVVQRTAVQPQVSLQQTRPQAQQLQTEMTMEMEDPEDSDDDVGGNGRSEKRAGRRKIRIEYIEDKSRRHITFSKRKAGIMKKAYELSTLTGTQVLLLVASETGHVYTFATPKLQPLITKPEGKNLIQACLNAPDGSDYQSVGYDQEEENDDRQAQVANTAGMTAMPQNYAAAIAGLTGYQYPGMTQATNQAALASAYMNPAHYPAYANQYNNAAMAAAYWPQQQQQQAVGSHGPLGQSTQDHDDGTDGSKH